MMVTCGNHHKETSRQETIARKLISKDVQVECSEVRAAVHNIILYKSYAKTVFLAENFPRSGY